MSRIVYLIGAGASSEALPVVADFKVALAEYRNYLVEIRERYSSSIDYKKKIENYIESSFKKKYHCKLPQKKSWYKTELQRTQNKLYVG